MKNFDCFLFDLDGTLTDPYEGITDSVVYALHKFGIRVEDKRTLTRFIGPPLAESFSAFYGFGAEEAEQAVAYYREYFAEKGIFRNAVYGGIEAVLQELKRRGKKLVVATSKPEVFSVRILEHFGLIRYFDFVAGATLDGSRQRKADVIRYALERCPFITKDRAVMVGDREHDIFGAKENGLQAAGVLYGFGSRAELQAAGADFIAETPKDILNLSEDNV